MDRLQAYTEGYRLDHGIDRVVVDALPPRDGPDFQLRLPPAVEVGVSSELAWLFDHPSIALDLQAALCPPPTDATVLVPDRFRGLLDGAVQCWHAMMAAEPSRAPVLDPAIQLLRKEGPLWQETHRNLLSLLRA